MTKQENFTAFADNERIAHGDLIHVAGVVRTVLAAKEFRAVLVFSDITGKQVDIDLREDLKSAPAHNDKPASETPTVASKPRRPGRPKLGVVGKEITLLPRHWDWLSVQPGGPSVVLRKLLEQARLASKEKDSLRQSREAAYAFMVAIAGNQPGFEEASRALFAGKRAGFDQQIQAWPQDIRDFLQRLAGDAFVQEEAPQ